jgi:hypothetical protein
MNRKKLIAALYALCSIITLQSITIVYNLRISQITRRQVITGNPSLFLANLFQQWFKSRYGLKQRDIGVLTSYIHTGTSWYVKVDGALAHVRNTLNCTTITRNQTDDILLSGGYGITPSEGTRVTFSGHLGIPTHKDTILEGIEFGTGHYAIGAQIDGSQAYKLGRPHFLLGAVRIIHFFPRTIASDNPALPQRYNFGLGNLVDIYLAHQTNWNMRHRIEFGYDGVWGFGANIRPAIANFGATIHFMRNNVFASYAHRIKAFNQPSAVLLTVSYGADTGKNPFGRAYIVTIVGSWAINF